MTPAVRPLDRLAISVVLLLCVSWGFNQITAKYALSEMPPLTQAALRSAIGTIFFGGFAFYRDRNLFSADGSLPGGLLCGLLFGVEFVVLFIALEYTTASHAILFLYSMPFFVALGLRFVAPDERFRRTQWVGLLLSFVGIALALGIGSLSREQLIGDVLSVAAGALWAATILVVKGSQLKNTRPEKVLLYQLFVSIFVLALGALVAREPFPTRLSPLVALCFAYQSLWIVSVTFFLWFWLVANYRAGELSAFTFLTPIFGVVASVILMGDPVTPAFIAAVALVAFGILLVNLPARKAA